METILTNISKIKEELNKKDPSRELSILKTKLEDLQIYVEAYQTILK